MNLCASADQSVSALTCSGSPAEKKGGEEQGFQVSGPLHKLLVNSLSPMEESTAGTGDGVGFYLKR